MSKLADVWAEANEVKCNRDQNVSATANVPVGGVKSCQHPQ